MSHKLVIVESPTKARTIGRFLGEEYRIEASMGHVRDLPASADQIPAAVKGKSWARLGVDVENDFQPLYIVPPDKKKIVSELRKALKNADELYIATDEDREGESIGWHLIQLLKPKIPTFRMVFHEITPQAIQDALDSPRQIDDRLVRAQEMRRILDRLVGYTVSPLLWKKIKPKLSAGRVQSAAVRLLVMRERERMSFHSASYWDLKAQLSKDEQTPCEARLHALDGVRLATGKDFDEATGCLFPDRKVLPLSEEEAKALVANLKGEDFKITSIVEKTSKRSPAPPFTTSTLQQEANKILGMSAKMTMQVAQRLYENGFITYMRTDSVHLSDQALEAACSLVKRRYGADHLVSKTRRFRTSKGAQEAHEAIRPAGTEMPTAIELNLQGPEARLYGLIWRRTIATQMTDAKYLSRTLHIEAIDPENGKVANFRASGREVTFAGFLRAQSSLDSDDDTFSRPNPLANLSEGDVLNAQDVLALSHQTKAPARFTEAALVKALEQNGIGRPSTYASIIDTVQKRGYVRAHQRQLIPTFIAFAVTQLLEATHGDVVDLAFTASMERRLDAIATGEDSENFLSDFYTDRLVGGVNRGAEIDPKEICTVANPKAAPYVVRVGRYGPFIEFFRNEERQTVSLPDDVAPADVDKDFIEALIKRAEKGREPLGLDPETSLPVYILVGRFGPYVQLGDEPKKAPKEPVVPGAPKRRKKKVVVPKPRRQSLLPNMKPEAVDLAIALQLLALPRPLGLHPVSGKEIKASIGRYGPYVLHEKSYASLKKTDDLFSVTLERALELFIEKSAKGKKREPVREMGNHPEDDQPIVVMDGKYGLYIKHNKTNASLPDGTTTEDLTLNHAVELLAARELAKPTKKKKVTKKKATKKKVTNKKATKKKVTKKKATTKKAATKKKTAKKAATKKKTAKKGIVKKGIVKKGIVKKRAAKKKTPLPTEEST